MKLNEIRSHLMANPGAKAFIHTKIGSSYHIHYIPNGSLINLLKTGGRLDDHNIEVDDDGDLMVLCANC